METTLLLLREMKMPVLQNKHETTPEISEMFLKHVEETTELLENPYAKSLLKEAIKQIRESKDKESK
jgi:hypothetical protein